MTTKSRLGLAAGYLGVIALAVGVVLPLVYAAVHPAMRVAVFWTHALPLLLARFAQDALFGGPDPQGRGGLIFLGIVVFLWWPLALFSAVPRLWGHLQLRRLTVGYLVAFLVLAIAAAAWLTIDPGLLAS